MKRQSINLKRPICTEDPDPVVHVYEDTETNLVQNTGIEREGGITNIYEQETTFGTAGLHSVYTKSGDLLQVDASHNVRINDVVIGNVGTYAVSQRGAIPGYSDAAWSASDTIIAIAKVGSTIRVDEINPATGAVTNTRSNTFAMPSVAITNVILVKCPGMLFADNLEFILSNNSISFVLKESGATTNVIGGITFTTKTLAANAWTSVCWSSQLNLFVAVGGGSTNYAATSPDGTTWTPRTLAANSWESVCWSSQLNLFVAVGGGSTNYAATSPDGTTWTPRTLAAGGWKSLCWSSQLSLFVAVGSTGTYRAATSSDGSTWNTRTIEANAWTSVCWSSQLNLFVAVGSGSTSYAATSPDGTTWTPQTLAAHSWTSVCWSPQLSLFVAVSSDGYSATSSNGVTWSATYVGNTWRSVCWSPQLSQLVTVGAGGAGFYAATSADGSTWTTQTLAGTAWNAVCWSTELMMFCGVGSTTNYAFIAVATINRINMAWRFSSSEYLIGGQGISGTWAIGNVTGTLTSIADATWCIIDQFAGSIYSRAILTFPVKKNAANLLTGIGEVGYNQAGAYSATPTYYGVALASVTVTITNNVSGPGYAEATFTRSDSGTNIYYYLAPIMGNGPGLWYDYAQSQTHTLCGGYGKLTNLVGNSLGNTCCLRVVSIPTTNGTTSQPALLSAGVIGSESTSPLDCLGVPLTNVGEFDEYFVPHVTDNGSSELHCLYRYAGVLFHFTITSGATNTLQRVSDNLYMVNCLSPVNAVDVAKKALTLGVNDYNGRILFRSSAAILGTSVKAVGVMQGLHVNSIDTGDKLITQTFSTTTNIVPAIELPSFVDRAVQDFGVNVYLSDTYSTTFQSYNVSSAKGDLANTLYISDTRIPFGMGYTFMPPVMQTEIETIFTGVGVTGSPDVNYDYLCYELGNQVEGLFETFGLFGQTFLFDGRSIYLASFSGSSYSGKAAPLAPATGMAFLGASPTMAYFLSSFDNSVYTFDGGRSLTKFHRFNQMGTITQGLYNVRDNTLLLDATDDLVWVRDGIITANAKSAAQLAASLTLCDTVNGIYLTNGTTTSWRYNWGAVGTLVPLTVQTGYFGVGSSGRGIVERYILTLYSAAKAGMVVQVNYWAFDQDAAYTQTAYIPVNTSDYTSDGMLRLKFIPQQARCMASSIGVVLTSKTVLLDITAEYSEEGDATIAASRSK